MRLRARLPARASTAAPRPDAPRLTPAAQTSRRAALLASGLAAVFPRAATAGAAAPVGSYLPPAPGLDGFVTFTVPMDRTPSLRAGTIKSPYTFALPAAWREGTVANIQSGNYCQPRCDEPWTEVIFSGPGGAARVMVSPLKRLTNDVRAGIDKVGTPAGVAQALGAYVTNNMPPEAEEVVAATAADVDGRATYYLEFNTPYALNPPRSLAVATAKDGLAYLFVVQATEKQWAVSEGALRTVAASFRP
jgi:hypothetical protein